MIGASSGIGWALATKIVANSVNIIAVGRQEEKPYKFPKHCRGTGIATVNTTVFDITKLDETPWVC